HMMIDAAGRRSWSPRGRPKIDARNNGYSHAEGGVATSYPAYGALTSRAKAVCASALLFAASLILPQVSVAQITPPGTLIRNVGVVAFSDGSQPRVVNSNEVSLAVVPLPSRATIQLA